MKKIVVFFLIAAVLLSFASLTGCKKDSGAIKIGVAGAHSGDLASY